MNCANCKEVAGWAFDARDFNRGRTEAEFGYYQCDHCGLVFMHPIRVDAKAYYDPAYYGVPDSHAVLRRRMGAEERKLTLVRDLVESGRLVDVGAGYGGFCLAARTAGYDVEPIEMDAECCAYMKDVLGLNPWQTSDPSQRLRELREIDVITIWHVVEHVPDPWALLSSAAGALRVGGILVVATPNPRSLQFRMFRGRWAHLDAPRHLFLLPHTVVEARLRPHGLSPVRLEAGPRVNIGHTVFGWEGSLLNVLPRRIRAMLPTRIMSRLFGLVARGLMFPLESKALNGPTYVGIYQK